MAHPTHASMKAKGHADHSAKVSKLSGMQEDVTRDKKMIEKAVHAHEKHDHAGSPLTKLKLSKGGGVKGTSSKLRLDRMGGKRGGFASGGAAKSKKGKSGNHVNVIVAPGGAGGARPPMMPPVPAAGGVPMPPPRPAMPPGGPVAGVGGPPGAPMGPRPPMGPPVGAGMRKHGGRAGKAAGGKVVNIEDGGAGGGLGRMEKITKYGKKKVGQESSAFSADLEDKANTFNKDTEFGKKRGGAC